MSSSAQPTKLRVVFVAVPNRIMQNVSEEFRNKREMDSNILKYQPIQSQMNAAALTSLWSKELKKKLWPCSHDQCCQWKHLLKSACLGEDGFPFLYCQTQFKTITCTPQHGENACSCVNMNALDAVHREEHGDMGRDLSWECEKGMRCLATWLCGNPRSRVASLVDILGSNSFVSTPDRTGCLAYLKRGWRITWWLFGALVYQISYCHSSGKI